MRVMVDVPDYVAEHLDFLIQERRAKRDGATVQTWKDEYGHIHTAKVVPPPLSRTIMLSKIVEFGFDEFIRAYPTAQSLMTLRGWPGANKPHGRRP